MTPLSDVRQLPASTVSAVVPDTGLHAPTTQLPAEQDWVDWAQMSAQDAVEAAHT